MTSEILNRADELRAAAAASETRAQFRMKYPHWNMESINHTLRITVLKPQAIAQIRAEVQRTLAQRLTIRDWAA